MEDDKSNMQDNSVTLEEEFMHFTSWKDNNTMIAYINYFEAIE